MRTLAQHLEKQITQINDLVRVISRDMVTFKPTSGQDDGQMKEEPARSQSMDLQNSCATSTLNILDNQDLLSRQD